MPMAERWRGRWTLEAGGWTLDAGLNAGSVKYNWLDSIIVCNNMQYRSISK